MAKRAPQGRQRKQLALPLCNEQHAFQYKVKSASADQFHRTITVFNGKKQPIKLRAQRFALVGPGDTVLADPHNPTRLSVVCTESPEDLIPVAPHFSRDAAIRLGKIDYRIQVREITTADDVAEYEYLEGFHYKTSTSIVSDDQEPQKGKAVGGRKAILMAYLQVGRRFLPAGYIELQMPLLMVKPRHVLFDLGFRHPTRDVEWDHWDLLSTHYVPLSRWADNAEVLLSIDSLMLSCESIRIRTAEPGLGSGTQSLFSTRVYARFTRLLCRVV